MSEPAARITDVGSGVFRIEHAGGVQRLAFAVVTAGTTWVFVDGETYVLEPARTRRAAGAHDAAALAAPMPATVTHLHVEVGQPVAKGDALVTLEAMKMELPIRAISDGTVTAIKCRVGDMVTPGIPLVEVSDT